MSTATLRCLSVGSWFLWLAVYWQGGRGLVTVLRQSARGEEPVSDAATMLGIVLPSVLLVTTGLLACRGRYRLRPRRQARRLAGAVMIALGMLGTIASRCYLGRFWSPATTVKDGQELVDRGSYRLVRHPTCASGIIMTLGTALMLPTWWNALASAVVTAAYGLKTRYEDSYLAANLAGYLPYRRRVRFRLIPGLW